MASGRIGRLGALTKCSAKCADTATRVAALGRPRLCFMDPNGLSLEYCCLVGNRPEPGALMRSEFTLPRAALELTDMLTKARSTGGRAKKGVSR